MRKSVFFLLLCLLSFIFPFFSQPAYAGELGVMLKLERLAPSTSTGGMVCATTPSSNNGTETSVQVIFPQGFVVNTDPSNWTVDTDNLPTNATAWPGITTATNISGYTVTFPSDDLQPDTKYCFNFASSNTVTTPNQTGNFPGTIRTRDGSNNIIDLRDYGVAIIPSDQIAVTATVPANPTDFSANLALTSPTNGVFLEGTTLTYTLTYGSLLSTSTNITAEAQWDLGTVQGSGIPTENILSYVVGSASNGYNSTPSVIDITNRKIDWVIPTITGNTTNQTVSFQLKTTSSYLGSLPVSFSVNGRILGPGITTPDSTVTSTYRYSYYITPTPTPTCAPGSCPTSVPQPTSILTPTPTGIPTGSIPKISDIQIRTVSSTEASIYVSTNKNTTAKIDYGTSLKNLNKTITDSIFSKQHLMALKDLKPNTRYYFKVSTTDNMNQKAISDFYSIDTALASAPPQAIPGSLIITSGDVVLADPLTVKGMVPILIIPQKTFYSFKFEVKYYSNIKLVRAVERNNNVLGIDSFESEPGSSGSISVIEISPGHYIGKLLSSSSTGNYRLFLQLQDYYGNLNEQKIADLYIVQPFKVIDQNSNQGIEDAKVTFYILNQRLKTYDLVASVVTPIKNPNYSEPDGNVWTVLPEGQYRAEISVLGYNSKTVDFRLSAASKSFYPTVSLIRQPFNILTYTSYYAKTTLDVITLLRSFAHSLRLSFRFFDLVAFALIAFLVFILTIATSKRLSVPIFSLPYFTYYHLMILFKKPKHNFLVHGRVSVLESDEPVHGALVYISHPNGKVISHTTTNLYGEFFTKIHEDADIKVIVSKIGYKSFIQHAVKGQFDKRMDLKITQKQNAGSFNVGNIRWYTEYLLGALLESFLFVSIGMEVLFSLEFGIFKVLPFIIVSFANLIIWAANMRAQRVSDQ